MVENLFISYYSVLLLYDNTYNIIMDVFKTIWKYEQCNVSYNKTFSIITARKCTQIYESTLYFVWA